MRVRTFVTNPSAPPSKGVVSRLLGEVEYHSLPATPKKVIREGMCGGVEFSITVQGVRSLPEKINYRKKSLAVRSGQVLAIMDKVLGCGVIWLEGGNAQIFCRVNGSEVKRQVLIADGTQHWLDKVERRLRYLQKVLSK